MILTSKWLRYARSQRLKDFEAKGRLTPTKIRTLVTGIGSSGNPEGDRAGEAYEADPPVTGRVKAETPIRKQGFRTAGTLNRSPLNPVCRSR